ncbi:MAG: hypothetical protein FWE86_04345 [Oscillospiraceae bacterium]|nr:hypothetical protein [Oscillospiraceae bacterium]
MKKGIVVISAVFLAVALIAGVILLFVLPAQKAQKGVRQRVLQGGPNIAGEFTLYDVVINIDGTEATFSEIPMQAWAQVEREDGKITEIVNTPCVEPIIETVIPDDDSLGEFFIQCAIETIWVSEKDVYHSDGSATRTFTFQIRVTPKTGEVFIERADTVFYYSEDITVEVTFSPDNTVSNQVDS